MPTISTGLLDDLKMYARFAWGLRGFLQETLTLEEAEAIVRRRLEQREENFLRLVEKGVFGYPRSPYLPLLKLAQVEYGDIKNMVRRNGLEDTLRALREAGVYVTFEEFKGREPIVRDGQVFPVQAHDFDNPYLKYAYQAESGGTTGAGTRVSIDLDHQAEQAPQMMLTLEVHDVLGVPTVGWFGVPPDPTGLMSVFNSASFGGIPDRWYAPNMQGQARYSLKDRLTVESAVMAGRVSGVRVPRPEPLGLDQADVLARWAASTAQAQGVCLVRSIVSRALRIGIAAQEAGLDLTGVTLMGGGEPPTPAKVRAMTQTGARWVPVYVFAEAGFVGAGCVHPIDGNDIHFFKDSLALIQGAQQIPGSDFSVDAFYFTSLLPAASKLMLNVESDDCGVIEQRSCGCPLEHYGYTEHLRHIYSFRKLTGEGVTLLGSEMIRILEDVLPTRFGGSPLDYQLMEEEDDQGFTRLSLIISPSLKIADEQAVIAMVLDTLAKSSTAADQARTIWLQAHALQVRRMEPIATGHGKLLPLHVAGRDMHSEQPDDQ